MKSRYPDWLPAAVRILARASEMVGGWRQMDPAGVLEIRRPARVVFWFFLKDPGPSADYLAHVFDGPSGGMWIRVYRAKWVIDQGWVRAGADHFISERQVDVFLYGDLREKALRGAKPPRQMEMF